MDLVQFDDTNFYELTRAEKHFGDDMIRSERRCRLDLRKWGARLEANSQRSYFEGHERVDVVKHRNGLTYHCLVYKDCYYTITDDGIPVCHVAAWNAPR